MVENQLTGAGLYRLHSHLRTSGNDLNIIKYMALSLASIVPEVADEVAEEAADAPGAVEAVDDVPPATVGALTEVREPPGLNGIEEVPAPKRKGRPPEANV